MTRLTHAFDHKLYSRGMSSSLFTSKTPCTLDHGANIMPQNRASSRLESHDECTLLQHHDQHAVTACERSEFAQVILL